MSHPSACSYEFGPFRLDGARRLLLRDGEPVPLTPKAFEILLALVESGGRVVGKDEILQKIWPDTVVEENNLTVNMSALRKALGDSPAERRYIATVSGQGYRFVADLRPPDDAGVGSQGPDEPAAGGDTLPPEPSALPPPRVGRRVPSPAIALGLAGGVVVLAVLSTAVYRYRSDPGVSPSAPIRSVAVLPLKSLSDDPAEDYFSDGMTESLIMALSRIEGLRVLSRGSVFGFKGKEVDPRRVGRRLGVTAVLEGSVRKSSDSVRVAVRLVSVEDGRVIWASDLHDRALGDIFALQDEIARSVAAGLRVNLSGERAGQLARRYTESVEAYQLYLKGRFLWNNRTEQSLKKSIGYFEQAIAADPGYALAYVGVADSYLVLKSLSFITPQEARQRVEAPLRRALEIDDTLGEAHTSLAWVRFSYDWDWPAAEREFRRAIELQPNHATTHQWYAEYLSAMGRFDESFAEIRRAQQLDPPSPIINVIAAQGHFFARQYDQAIEQCRKTLELAPDFYIAHDYLGWSYRQKGMYDAAIAEFEKARRIEDTPLQLCEIGITYAAAGDEERARKVVQDVIEGSKRTQGPRHCYRLARIHAAMRSPDAAFEWLERAFKEREENLVWLKVDPHLDALRADPRFADLERRIGFAPAPLPSSR